MAISQRNRVSWCDEKGKELVYLRDDGTACVVPAYADADMLDDLAEACAAASEALHLIADAKKGEPCDA
jgi:hypothetical protein